MTSISNSDYIASIEESASIICSEIGPEKENINTGSMESELFLSILSSMAADESLSISLNSKWSIKKRFENGTFKISYPPYGYNWDGDTMAINPEQAQIVRCQGRIKLLKTDIRVLPRVKMQIHGHGIQPIPLL